MVDRLEKLFKELRGDVLLAVDHILKMPDQPLDMEKGPSEFGKQDSSGGDSFSSQQQ